MYAAYFGLKENPFNLSPEPRYLFPERTTSGRFELPDLRH